MNDKLLDLVLLDAPMLIQRIKQLFVHVNPDDPQPSDADVVEAYNAAFQTSLGEDDALENKYVGELQAGDSEK